MVIVESLAEHVSAAYAFGIRAGWHLGKVNFNWKDHMRDREYIQTGNVKSLPPEFQLEAFKLEALINRVVEANMDEEV